MFGSWQAERGSRRTRRHPRDDPRAEVGEDARVGVGVRVSPVEFQLNGSWAASAVSIFDRLEQRQVTDQKSDRPTTGRFIRDARKTPSPQQHQCRRGRPVAVSYTHLTLPTILRV